jgi:hypothetical protein
VVSGAGVYIKNQFSCRWQFTDVRRRARGALPRPMHVVVAER